MIIKITNEHIRRAKGFEGEIDSCPVALAASESLDRKVCADYYQEDQDDYGKVILRMGGERILFYNMELTKFMENFDDGLEVRPMEFEIPKISPN